MEQIDGIASTITNGLGIWIPISECPKKAIRKMCKRKERPNAGRRSVWRTIADLNEMCSSALIRMGDRDFICICRRRSRESMPTDGR